MSIEAEQSVIGSMMLSEAAVLEVSDWLKPDDFFIESHRVMFGAILELTANSKPCDAVTLGEWIEQKGVAETVGGIKRVIEIANQTPSAKNVKAYADIVAEKARLRKAIEIGTRMANAAYEPLAISQDIFAGAAVEIAEMSGDTRFGGPEQIGASVDDWERDLIQRRESDKRINGIATPWRSLTDLLGGLEPGCMYIIAGRPKMGKSTVAGEIAWATADAGETVYLASLEMSKKKVVQRGVACMGHVSYAGLAKPWLLDDDELHVVKRTTQRLRQLPLIIDDTRRQTVPQLLARLRREHLRRPIKLAVIDHLHEVKLPDMKRFGELADACRTIRAAANDLGIAVVLLAQLNRDVTGRTDRRPTVADLRGDGGIEEVCDAALFIHREEYYDRSTHLKGVVEINLGAGRDVVTGETLYFQNRFDQMRLVEWEGPLPEPPKKERKKKEGDSDAAPTVSLADAARKHKQHKEGFDD